MPQDLQHHTIIDDRPIALAVVGASCVLWGALEALVGGHPLLILVIDVSHILVIVGMLLWWATADAESSGRKLSPVMAAGIAIGGVVGVLVYLATTRPRSEWVWLLIKVIGFSSLFVSFYVSTCLAVALVGVQF